MSEKIAEICSIVVVGRDRFSTTESSLDSVIAHTAQVNPILCVVGGAPKHLREAWASHYGQRVKFLFEERFLNPAEARNIGLRAVKTRLAILMDNDVRVRSGWLEPLIDCERETGASMVVPLILEGEKTIHTAGNQFYVTYENGKAYASKVLPAYKQTFCESSNLKRGKTDYGELHCQLVVTKTALDLNVYDEKLREVGECDSALTWLKAGCSLYFEPASVVVYDFPKRITSVDDISFFSWRWDMRAILEGYRHFRQKWGIDISEYGKFHNFLAEINLKLGLLPRHFPSRLALEIDYRLRRLRQLLMKSLRLWGNLKTRLWGAGDWAGDFKKMAR